MGGGLERHYSETGHEMMINTHTLEIHCVPCKQEVLDLDMYERQEIAEEDINYFPQVNVRVIRDLFTKQMKIGRIILTS